jgi:hypothetical protein
MLENSVGEKGLLRQKGELETEYRRLTRERLLEVLGAKGSGISPYLAAEFLDVSAREVSRWRDSSTGFWIPKLQYCESILAFVDIVNSLRAMWPTLIDLWAKAKVAFPFQTYFRYFINPSLVRILENKQLTPAERVESLVIQSLRILRETIIAERAAESKEADHVETT